MLSVFEPVRIIAVSIPMARGKRALLSLLDHDVPSRPACRNMFKAEIRILGNMEVPERVTLFLLERNEPGVLE